MDTVLSTYCCSLTDKVCALITLAVDDQPVSPITKMMFHTLLPNIAAKTMQKGSQGNTKKKSVTLIRRLSIQPPKYPAAIPIMVPKTIEIIVAVRPTIKELLAPLTRYASTSLPWLSVPRRCSKDGALKTSALESAMSVVLKGISRGPNIAISTKNPMIMMPTLAILLCHTSLKNSLVFIFLRSRLVVDNLFPFMTRLL